MEQRVSDEATRPRFEAALIGRRGATMIAIGTAAGLAFSPLIARLMAGLLFGIRPTDPLTLVSDVLVLVTVALAATWIPARSAANVNPLVALRYE
jgi:ABC-type antimicrobial peptide transport system permease subunit